MDTQRQQIVDRLKQANNILVTVKSNPTVDHLAACIALTLALNKLGKHATAVFSGNVPSTIEFLQPEKTLEKNTDSLRDFIIALDKSKADKLRYKVEDKVVKIFITPYKTSISEKDLEFSQGDFNVDVVLALGVHQQADLDQAITAHGRILHDATVVSVNVEAGPNLGSLNWTKPNASSLSELAVELMDGLEKSLLDGQIATAALTGIVAETDRFSNNRTSPQTMSISAELMAVGANQQLVATKLAEPPQPPAVPVSEEGKPAPAATRTDDGTLEIEHEGKHAEPPQIEIDEDGALHTEPVESIPELKPEASALTEEPPQPAEPPEKAEKISEAEAAGLPAKPELPKITPEHAEPPHMVLEPPSLGGQLTAAASSEFFDPLVDAASGAPPQPPILNREPLGRPHNDAAASAPPVTPSIEPPQSPVNNASMSSPAVEPVMPASASPAPPPKWTPPSTPTPPTPIEDETLSDIEKQLHSPHASEESGVLISNGPPPDVSSARNAVAQAVDNSLAAPTLGPIQVLNAQPLGQNDLLGGALPAPAESGPAVSPAIIPENPAPFAPEGLTLPGVTGATESPTTPPTPPVPGTQGADPNAAPPVPPPFMPPAAG